jgi:hypothetical protein
LTAAALTLMVQDLFRQMVKAKVAEELARRAEEAAQVAALQPVLEQAA